MVPLYVLIWVGIGGGIGAAIGSSKGRGGEGFGLGLLLGFIGWIIVAVMEPSTEHRNMRASELAKVIQGSSEATQQRPNSSDRACPWCAELIKPAAVVCRFCGRDVPHMETSAPTLSANQELEIWLLTESPRWAKYALEIYGTMTPQPINPKEWLAELSKRLDNGSDGIAAANKIPLTFPN